MDLTDDEPGKRTGLVFVVEEIVRPAEHVVLFEVFKDDFIPVRAEFVRIGARNDVGDVLCFSRNHATVRVMPHEILHRVLQKRNSPNLEPPRIKEEQKGLTRFKIPVLNHDSFRFFPTRLLFRLGLPLGHRFVIRLNHPTIGETLLPGCLTRTAFGFFRRDLFGDFPEIRDDVGIRFFRNFLFLSSPCGAGQRHQSR